MRVVDVQVLAGLNTCETCAASICGNSPACIHPAICCKGQRVSCATCHLYHTAASQPRHDRRRQDVRSASNTQAAVSADAQHTRAYSPSATSFAAVATSGCRDRWASAEIAGNHNIPLLACHKASLFAGSTARKRKPPGSMTAGSTARRTCHGPKSPPHPPPALLRCALRLH